MIGFPHDIMDLVCPSRPYPVKAPLVAGVVIHVIHALMMSGVLVVEEGCTYTSARFSGVDGYAAMGPRLCLRRLRNACVDFFRWPRPLVCMSHFHTEKVHGRASADF